MKGFVLIFLVVLTSVLQAAIQPKQSITFKSDSGLDVQLDLLAHPLDGEKSVEVIWSKPEGEGPFPVLIFLHPQIYKGGAVSYMNHFGWRVNRGCIAAAVSLPGHGLSNGSKDFNGETAIQALLEVLDYFREQSFVQAEKIGLCGFGMGGISALLTAAKDPHLACVISVNGGYKNCNAYEEIQCPALLIHSEENEYVPLSEVQAFFEMAMVKNRDCQLVVVPGKESLPHDALQNVATPFADRYLLNTAD